MRISDRVVCIYHYKNMFLCFARSSLTLWSMTYPTVAGSPQWYVYQFLLVRGFSIKSKYRKG